MPKKYEMTGMVVLRVLHQSNINIHRPQRVVFNKLSARLDFVAHEGGEHTVGLDRVFDLHFEQAAHCWVHGGFPELLGVHLAQAFVHPDGGRADQPEPWPAVHHHRGLRRAQHRHHRPDVYWRGLHQHNGHRADQQQHCARGPGQPAGRRGNADNCSCDCFGKRCCIGDSGIQ